MGDVDDGRALVAEAAEELEQPVDLLLRERGGRLVEDQDARLVGERLRDLDDLPLADAQRADRARPGRGRRPSGRARLRPLADRAPADEAAPGGEPAERDVLGHGQRRRVLELLVDHPDAGGPGRDRRQVREALAADLDLARVGRVVAGEDLDERRLARRRSRRHRFGAMVSNTRRTPDTRRIRRLKPPRALEVQACPGRRCTAAPACRRRLERGTDDT